MRLHRLIATILLLESRRKIKAKELADALETSVRTVYRDIDTLCEAGLPIATTTGPNGGIYLMEGYSVDMNRLHNEEVVNLFLSGIGIQPDKQSDSSIKLKNALLKLEDSLPSEYNEDIRKARERFYFDETPWWGEYKQVVYLDSIRKALWQSSKLYVYYQKFSGEISSRIIHPYGLVVKRMEWYLIAYCEKSDDIRTFKCERMTRVDVLDEDFIIPEDFSLAEYWQGSVTKFKEGCIQVENYVATIKVSESKKYILDQLDVLESYQEHGGIVATVNMYKFEEACLFVIDHIGHIEILQPVELRNYASEEVSKLYTIYHN
ncbi:helix-turn-helix transcriptional regulator [Vallitalea okinawensis]|uniref:helix-turn-helix transcriptional regulator n=1 Tax=Vallitalea okinawensis TaxID=2078660 RepID=UPI000CFBFF27|nr:YafY family protein [Vallitalea okinawensis]